MFLTEIVHLYTSMSSGAQSKLLQNRQNQNSSHMWTLFCHEEITATFKQWMEINHQMVFCFSPVNIFSQTRVGPLCLFLSLRHWIHSCNKWLSHVQQCSFNDNLLMESLDWRKWPLRNSLLSLRPLLCFASFSSTTLLLFFKMLARKPEWDGVHLSPLHNWKRKESYLIIFRGGSWARPSARFCSQWFAIGRSRK